MYDKEKKKKKRAEKTGRTGKKKEKGRGCLVNSERKRDTLPTAIASVRNQLSAFIITCG